MASFERLKRLSDAERASRAANAADKEARDREIEELDQAGHTNADIARAGQLSPGHVQRVIAARTAARQARQAAPAQGPTGD